MQKRRKEENLFENSYLRSTKDVINAFQSAYEHIFEENRLWQRPESIDRRLIRKICKENA